ncbi:MAG: transcription elongation factor Spt5, partial [Thermoprotei archaeon]
MSSEEGSTNSGERRRVPISKYVVLRTTAGQEVNVALMLEAASKSVKARGIYSIIVPPEIKGYIIIETEGLHVVHRVARDIKHVKGKAMGSLRRDEVERLIKVKPPIEELKPGDIVEIISGPFKGLKASVVSVDMQKNLVTLNILEASFKMEATIPADNVR